jgi:hypothetical protein
LEDKHPTDRKHVQKQWSNDPFDGWLRSNLSKDHPSGHNEKIQQAKLERHLMRLPSFKEDQDNKRSDGNEDDEDHHKSIRNYVDHQQRIRPRSRYGDVPAIEDHSWKDDAFFGWLPGRGGHSGGTHELHRPLENARLKRLPSFTEPAEMKFMGLRGTGIGVLKVNIKAATGLAYMEDHRHLKGRPSACVQLQLVKSDGHKDETGSKYTATVEAEQNPRFDSGFFQFEVFSMTEHLRLRVYDIFLQPKEFLGEVVHPVKEIIDDFSRGHQDQRPGHYRKSLTQISSRGELFYECSYVPYSGEGLSVQHGTRQIQDSQHRDRQQHRDQEYDQLSRPASHGSRSFSQHASGSIGELQVHIVRAENLANLDTGFEFRALGYKDVSDPYVKVGLREQGEAKKQRTKTVNNDLNPHWQEESAKIFTVDNPHDVLVFEVFNENGPLRGKDQSLGRMEVPVNNIIQNFQNDLCLLSDNLKDAPGGIKSVLEVQIGFFSDHHHSRHGAM